MNKEFSIIIPSIRLELAKEAKKSLYPLDVIIKYSETKAKSFSELINKCIVEAESEIVIICNDKARASKQHVLDMLDLIIKGYGIVGFYRFGFFGFKKELIRRIGFFDERFVGGGYEDWDMIRRIKEANIAYFEKDIIPYIDMPSTWAYYTNIRFCPSAQHLKNKWGDDYIKEKVKIKRLLKEELYNYDIGPSVNTDFLLWKESVLHGWRKLRCVSL